MKNRKLITVALILLSTSFFGAAFAAENETLSMELREKVLKMDPRNIGITGEKLKHPVWGILMETGYADGAFSLIALADGTTSLAFSNGGGIIGGGEHQNVRKASGYLLSGAQYFYPDATPATRFPLPAKGEVKFYLLSFDGVKEYTSLEKDPVNRRDRLSNLFFAAHDVIEELRKIEEE